MTGINTGFNTHRMQQASGGSLGLPAAFVSGAGKRTKWVLDPMNFGNANPDIYRFNPAGYLDLPMRASTRSTSLQLLSSLNDQESNEAGRTPSFIDKIGAKR